MRWADSSPSPCRTPGGSRRGLWRRSAGPASAPSAWSLAAFGPQTPFPGPAALIPVAGTGVVLVAGTRRRRCRAGAACSVVSPLQPIGAVSYTWYLWHWPALVLAPYVVGHQLGLAENVAVCVFSLVLAALTTVLLEQPVRRSSWLSARSGRSLVAGGALSLGAALAAVLIVAAVPPPVGSGQAAGAARLVTRHDPAGGSSSTTPSAIATAESLDAQVNRFVYESLANPQVPASLTPSLADAAADIPVPRATAASTASPTPSYTPACTAIRAPPAASCSSVTRTPSCGSRPSTTWRTSSTTPSS